MHKILSNSWPWAFADTQWNLFNYSSSPYIGCCAGVIGEFDPMVLGIQEHLLLIEACTLWKCFNVILEACPKKGCQHIFFFVRPLFGQEYSRALSFCLWFTTLSPFAFKYGLAVFNEAEVAELERHHQHCSSRENFSSDKSLNQLPGFFVLF